MLSLAGYSGVKAAVFVAGFCPALLSLQVWLQPVALPVHVISGLAVLLYVSHQFAGTHVPQHLLHGDDS